MKRLDLASAGGLAAAFVGVALSSCCALPMALVFMGVSTGAVGLLGPLHAVRPVILAIAGVLLASAWVFAVRGRAARAYPVLVVGTLLFALSFFWESWDPLLQHLVLRTLHP